MRTLIVYASKTGTTENCARKLQLKLRNTTVIDITEQKVDLSPFDTVIIGSPIRMGKINKQLKKFLIKHKAQLKNKKTAYFICCAFTENYERYFKENIPQELLNSAITYNTFGGEMDVNKQKGIDRFIVNMLNNAGEGKKEVKIINENIEAFVKRINQS